MRSIYTISLTCLLFAACNNAGESNNSTAASATKTVTPASKEPVQSRLNAEGTSMLMGVVTRYYALKNALVATKAEPTGSAAAELATAAGNMQAFLQKDTTNYAALKLYMDTIATQSRLISGIQDATCEKQRLAFGTLSSAVYSLLKHADVRNAGVYHTFCPMAFNDKGAYWLSEESEIKNPYFGKKMLECGEVTDSL